MAWHLRSEFGVKTIRYQAIPCAWSATSSLFAYTHSSLKPTLCFGFQGYIPLRLPAICVCLCSPLRCETYARSGLHNYASFYPNNSLAQRFWPHNTLNNTPRLYTSSSPRTPSYLGLCVYLLALTNGWAVPHTLGVAFPLGLFACNHQGLCLCSVAQWNLHKLRLHCSSARRHRFAQLHYIP